MPDSDLHLTPQGGKRAGEDISITGDKFRIGREQGDLILDDDEVSREHAEIRRTESGEYEIADLGSRNGVYVNGQKISAPTKLKAGDELRVGETTISVGGRGGETRLGGGATRLAGAGAGATRMAASPPPIVLAGTSGPGSGKEVALEGDAVTIGRESDCDLTLDDDEVSRHHAEIRKAEGGAEIRDLGSRNGTFVDGTRISGPTPLRGGETVKIGQTSFDARGEGATARMTAAAPAAQGAAKPIEKPMTPSGVQRQKLQTSVNRATIVAGVAGALALLVVVLAVAGVFSGDDEEPAPAPVAEGAPEARDVIADVTPSTVLVNAYVGNQNVGNGTGWVYNADEGLIVTNAHVVAAGDRFEIGVGDELRRAQVVGVSPCDDLALLKTNRVKDLVTLALGSQDEIALGDRVFAIGYPINASIDSELVVTEGTVSVVKTRPDASGAVDPNSITYPNVVQIDATINPGNSGGPSVNDDRELVAVNTFTAGVEDQNFGIGVDQVKEVIPILASGDSIGYAGFDVEAVQDNAGNGALQVAAVLPNSTAQLAGIEQGMIILEVGGQRTETQQDYCNAVQNVESGETVPLEVITPDGRSGTARVPFE